MKKVTGIGGVFFKASDQASLSKWYEDHLGIAIDSYGGHSFRWLEEHKPERVGYTVFSLFAGDTDYFAPGKSPFMINFRVDNLHALLDELRASGVEVMDKTEEHEYGKFGWIMDPDGNKIELWEPPDTNDPFAEDE